MSHKLTTHSRVPALEDTNTGIVSWESGAVINYILRKYDTSNKFGPREGDQAHVDYDKWTFFLVSSLGPMMGQVNWYVSVHQTQSPLAVHNASVKV